MRGSTLVVGGNKEIVQLSAMSLERIADAVELDQVHNDNILSLTFSKNGQLYLFILSNYYELKVIICF